MREREREREMSLSGFRLIRSPSNCESRFKKGGKKIKIAFLKNTTAPNHKMLRTRLI
jgi:hypothetical protein